MRLALRLVIWACVLAGVGGFAAVGYATRESWLPSKTSGGSASSGGHDHEEGHAHGEHGAGDSIVLSDQAKRNLDLKVGPVAIGEYWRTITVPGTVIERPGHSHRKLAAPMTGIVKELYVHPNQVVRPGDRIAELELKGDALASGQSELLQVVSDLDLNAKELSRIGKLVQTGTVAEQDELKLKYERQRLESQLESKKQQLEVLGLTKEQLAEIASTKQLLRSFVLTAPAISSEERGHLAEAASLAKAGSNPEIAAAVKSASDPVYTLESIDVSPGKRVEAGEEIGSLAFHVILYVEGQAFEREGEVVAKAMIDRWPVTAKFETGADERLIRKNLVILFVDNVIDPQSRTFKFFLGLPNEVLHDNVGPLGEPYRSWRFKPGQRVELEVPIERMTDVIVLPAEAVVREGPQAFVFRVNGKKLERQSVEVDFAGRDSVVVANDGSVFPGDMLAMNNAYQINLAIKKASGAGGGGHEHHDHSH